MNYKFIYMKILGFLTAIVGFSYSLTTCYNLFDLIFNSKIVTNLIVVIEMGLGVVFPLFVFVFGVFYYFAADITLKNKVIDFCILVNIIINLFFLIIYWFDVSFIKNIVELIHFSFGYVLLILNIFFVYGKYKHNY